MVIRNDVDAEDKKLITLILVCSSCILLCALTSIEMFMVLYLMFSAASILLLTRKEGVYFLMSIVSFSNIVTLAPNYTVTLHICLTGLFLVKYFTDRILLPKIPLLFYIVSAIYMLAGTEASGTGFFADLKTIVNYFFLLVLVSFTNQINKYKVFDYYIVGHLIATGLSIPVRNSDRFLKVMAYATTEEATFDVFRFSGLDFDTNFFGLNCAFIIATLLFFLSNAEKLKLSEKNLKRFLCLYVFLGALTFSKMYMITVSTLILAYYLSNFSRKFTNFVLFLIDVVVVFYILDIATNGRIVTILFGRFIQTGGDIYKLTSARSMIWDAYIEAWKSSTINMWLGVGMAHKKLKWLNHMHHNVYIEILYQFGIVGSLIFGCYLMSIYDYLKMRNRFNISIGKIRTYSRYLGFLAVGLCGISLGFLAYDFAIQILFLSFVMVSGFSIVEGKN